MKNLTTTTALAFALCCFAACGGDSGSASDSDSGDIVSKDGVKEGIAETVDELANCSVKLEGNLVYISSENAGYVCDGKTWKLDKDPLDDEDEGLDDVDFDNPSDDGEVENPDAESSDSSAKHRSSSSTRKSSSSMAVVDEKSCSSVQEGEASSSDGKKGSSDSSEKQSSGSEEGRSSNSSESGSSGGEIASSSSSPVDEVAETLEKAVVCTEARIGYRVYIQDENVWYACTEIGYVEEDHSSSSESDSGESSSSGSSSSFVLYDKNVEGLRRVIDTRDNQVYDLVTIGQQVWMATNLNYVTTGGNADNKSGSWCYDNLSANCDSKGRLYTWAAAMDVDDEYNMKSLSREEPVQGICPNGLRLPTSAEWQELFDFVESPTNLSKYGFMRSNSCQYLQVNMKGFVCEGDGYNDYYRHYWTPSETDDGSANLWRESVYWWGKSKGYKLDGYAVRCMESLPTFVAHSLGECGNNERLGTFGRLDTVLFYCDKAYVTESGTVTLRYEWRKATIVEQDTYLGETTEGNLMKGLVTGTYYIYREGEWRKATLEEVLGECPNMADLGGFGWYEGELYRCAKNKNTKLFGWRKATAVEQDVEKETDGKKCASAEVGKIVNGVETTNNRYYCSVNGWVIFEGGWSWDVPKESRFNPDKSYGIMKDERDGQTYRTVKIGDQVWMAENLNYADSSRTTSLKGKSWCYNDERENCEVTGRLYTWAAAIDSVALANDVDNPLTCGSNNVCTLPTIVQGICPEGWHLPTETEWQILFTAVGGQDKAGTALKSQTGWSSQTGDAVDRDAYGFSALPAGERDRYSRNFEEAGSDAHFLSTTQREWYSPQAYYMNLHYDDENASLDFKEKLSAFSVRCLQDSN